MNAIKQLQTLYDQELYSNVIHLAELSLPFYESKDLSIQYEIYLYYADALYETQHFAQADSAYSWALKMRKFIAKTKSVANKVETPRDGESQMTEADIKYKIYLCRNKLNMTQKAIDVLQTIPAKTRGPKVNMALGDLYMDAGLERPAAACYKEVLRESSAALLAAEKLLKLGVKGIEVNALIVDAAVEHNWINTWLRGQAHMHAKEYSAAITAFKSIDALKENVNLLVTLAHCFVYQCDEQKAIQTLKRVVRIDAHFTVGRDLFATLLANSGDKDDLRELERLATVEVETSRWSCEHWIVMGWHLYASKKYEKAAFFGHQACLMQRGNVEGLLLKAMSLVSLMKFVEALLHFKDAIHHAPNRFEVHKGMVECNLTLLRVREAHTIAANACKMLNNSPQALTLYAKVIMKYPSTNVKVRNLLEKALADDPSFSPAVCLFAAYLEQEQNYEEACQILQDFVDKYPTSKTHQLLADNYARLQRVDDAVTHYNASLRLDPQNKRAVDGINNLDKSHTKLDSNYYMTPENNISYSTQGPNVASDELEESDSDAWAPNSSDFMSL